MDAEPAWAPDPSGELVPWDEPEGEVSEWQAAWEGGAGEPDPRIGRPARTGTLLALLAAVVAARRGFPVVAAVVAVLWSWAARTADRSVTSLVLRRHNRGRRRSDVPLAVVASPWHLVVGALATVVSAILPLVVGICAVFSTALATVAVNGGSPHPNSPAPLAVGAARRRPDGVVGARAAPACAGAPAASSAASAPGRGPTPGRWSVLALLVAAGLVVVEPAERRRARLVAHPGAVARCCPGWASMTDGRTAGRRDPARARPSPGPRQPAKRRPVLRQSRIWRGEELTETLPMIESRCGTRPTATPGCARRPPRSARRGRRSTSRCGSAS